MRVHSVFNKKAVFNKKISVGLRRALIVLPLFVIASCGGGSGDTPVPTSTSVEFSQSAKLIANAANIMQGGYAQLATSTAALESSVGAYCATVTGGNVGGATERTAAQAAFKTAMGDVQRSSLHLLGPALTGNQMLQLYSWPTTDHCRIDQKLAENKPALNTAVNQRGMDALEYLLFVAPDASHVCPDGALPVQALADFNALSAADKQARRCAFMQPVVTDVVASANILANAWDVNLGNYVGTMIATTNVSTTLNEVTDAMYFFREKLREFKLDRPLGGNLTNTTPSCGLGNLCPADVESPYARISIENIRANALAFQTLYLGGVDATAIGFDDWLREVGKGTLADRLNTEITTVLTRIDEMGTATLFDTINGGNTIPANALLDAVMVVSKTLRDNTLPALGLSVPQGLASDTD
jgi:predicted lipoprotein